MGVALHFFNPREAEFQTLEALFVGRQALLDELIDDLKRQASSKSRQHWLLRGPRGIGKTHLTALLYHNVLSDPVLRKAYIPVWLPEPAAISAFGIDNLLLQVGEELARQVGGNIGADLSRRLAELEGEAGSPELFEGALEALRDVAEEQGKILLVLLENLDVLLTTLADRRGKAEARQLRALLLGEPRFLFVSTTTVPHLAEIERSEKPLFAQFRERPLPPLTEEQVAELLGKLAEITGRPLTQGSFERQRRRVFHRLTGGNPRAIGLGFAALSGAEDMAGLVAEMKALLDAQTPYFEARLAVLAPRERGIVEVLGLAPTNLTQQEIARLTRLPAQALSTQIARLKAAGILAPADGEGGKGVVYELADGLFRVWMQYRRAAGVLQPLVRFVALWYQPEEIEHSLTELSAISEGPLAIGDLRRSVARQLEAARDWGRSEEGRRERERLWAEVEPGAGEAAAALHEALRDTAEAALAQGDVESLRNAVTSVEEWLGSKRSLEEAIFAAELLYELGGALFQGNYLDEALRTCEIVLQQFGERTEPALLEQVAKALFNRGGALDKVGRREEALEAWIEVERRFGERHEPAFLESVASALVNRGSAFYEAGRSDEALEAWAEVERRFGERSEPALLEPVARALVLRGVVLSQAGRRDEALETLEGALRRVGEPANPELREVASRAIALRAYLLGESRSSAWLAELGDLPALLPSILEITAPQMLRVLKPAAVREALEPLLSSRGELATAARQWAFVAEILSAEEGGGQGTPGARRRKALARVPPELRQTVEELAAAISKERRARKKHAGSPPRLRQKQTARRGSQPKPPSSSV